MKLIHTLPLVIATACLTFSGCDKKPGTADSGAAPKVVDEKTTIANFKVEVENFGKWAEEKGNAAQSDPMSGLAMMGELSGKFKSIKTDGLPADLKGAWGEMGGVLGEMADLFKDIKIPKTDKPEDAQKALAEMAPKMMEIMPKLQVVQAKAEPIVKNLKEIGTKYGLDMSKVGPGK